MSSSGLIGATSEAQVLEAVSAAIVSKDGTPFAGPSAGDLAAYLTAKGAMVCAELSWVLGSEGVQWSWASRAKGSVLVAVPAGRARRSVGVEEVHAAWVAHEDRHFRIVLRSRAAVSILIRGGCVDCQADSFSRALVSFGSGTGGRRRWAVRETWRAWWPGPRL